MFVFMCVVANLFLSLNTKGCVLLYEFPPFSSSRACEITATLLCYPTFLSAASHPPSSTDSLAACRNYGRQRRGRGETLGLK